MTAYCYVHSVNSAWVARVNQTTFTYPIAEVTYDGASGSESAIEVGMTVLFGTSAGADDLGRQRIRKAADASKIYFGRSSRGVLDGEVALENDAHITVLIDWRPWMVAPFIDDDGTIYKDHDIAYSDQNEDSPPVANAGPDRYGTIDSGTSKLRLTLPPSANTSFATADGASISSYQWTLPGGSSLVSGALTDSQITVDCDPGSRYFELEVTDSNGKTATARVFNYTRDPDSDTTIPVQIEDHRRTPEGQEISIRLLETLPTASLTNGTRVVIWEGEPSGPTDTSHQVFSGWHMSDPEEVRAGRTGFTRGSVMRCGDIAAMMRRMPAFPVEIASDATPANWGQMVAPNMDKYLHFLMAHHTNVLELADWTDTGTGSNFPFVILGSDGESMWDQLLRKAKALVPDYVLTCNRLGQLQTIVDPMLQDSGDRTATVQKALDEGDIADISWDGQAFPRVHWLRGEAILADADNIAAIFCIAPGTAPGQGLNEQPSGEQLAQSQADLNSCEGHRYARLNAPYSYFNIILAGADDFDIDPANMTWITATLGSSYASFRSLTLGAARFLVHELTTTWEQTATGLVKTHELLCELETEGEAATTEIIEQTEDPPYDPGGDDWPPGDGDGPPLGWGTQNIAGVNTDGYVYVTSDFQTPSAAGGPTWARTSLGLSGTVFQFVVDPFCPGYLSTGTDVNGWVVTSTNIYYVEDLFGSPSATNQHTFANALGSPDGRRMIDASFGNFNSNQAWVMVVSSYQDSAGHTGIWSIYSQDGGVNWSSEAQLSAHYATGHGPVPGIYISPKTGGLAYSAAFLSTAAQPITDGYYTTDYGATWARISNPDIQPGTSLAAGIHVPWIDNASEDIVFHMHQAFSGGNIIYRTKKVQGTGISEVSPSDGTRTFAPYNGNFGVHAYDLDRRFVVLAGVGDTTGAGQMHAIFISSDYGESWMQIYDTHALATTGPRNAAFGGDSEQVIYLWGAGGYIAFSQDFGANIDDRSGNISSLGTPGRFAGIAGGLS